MNVENIDGTFKSSLLTTPWAPLLPKACALGEAALHDFMYWIAHPQYHHPATFMNLNFIQHGGISHSFIG